MYNVGVFFGKMIPPHRGHLYQIIEASTQCKHLYIILCDNKEETKEVCGKAGIQIIPTALRKKWLAQELQDLEHVTVLMYQEDDYNDIPRYPNGWDAWMKHLIELVPAHIDAFFVGEAVYKEKIPQYCDAEVVLFDFSRSRYPISATEIRNNPLKHWDYILGPARPFFAKRVLIAGTESCGKTSLTLKLAKLHYTSWSDEVGRHYAKKFLGGDESIFTDDDFIRIAYLQHEQDLQALRTANKIVFFDTDALITDYYSELYMGHSNEQVQAFIDPSKYDIVLFLSPEVKWVNDGQRLNGEQGQREALHAKLLQKYKDWGFGDKIVIITGNDYFSRLQQSLVEVDKLLG